MTIITKTDKYLEKLFPLAFKGKQEPILPGALLDKQRLANANAAAGCDAELMLYPSTPISCLRTTLLFLISVLIMMLGLLGGYTLYNMYAPNTDRMHYHAFCDIPYEIDNNSLPHLYPRFGGLQRFAENLHSLQDDSYFREEIELGMDEQDNYAKVNVPDFKDGRQGRFIHDFKANQSAIIDTTARRCFIMPLDRETTLPPKDFVELIQKTASGYYNINTERVRRTMRIVLPPLTDLSSISQSIAKQCYAMNVYMMEKYIGGIFKREAVPITESGRFAEFLGKGVVEFDLLNIADVEQYEQKNSN